VTNILLSVQGTVGDLVPILRIGSILKASGDSVTLMTHCVYEQLVRQAGLEFVALDTPQEFEPYLNDMSLCETPMGNIVFQKRHVLPLAGKEARLLLERCGDPNTILIGNHLYLLGLQLAAEKMRLPLVRMFHGAVNVARLSLFEMMYRDVLAEEINALRAGMDLPKVADWGAWARYSQCNIGAWPEWFAPPGPDWPQGLELVLSGFLTVDELEQGEIPSELEEFLQAGEPPVLITGSTGTYLKKGFYAACVEGCRLAGRRGIVATRFQNELPSPLPDQVAWFPSLPFATLMPRVAAVIHHGGIGTVARAIRSATPQLVLAMGADRPDNAQRLQKLGIAEYLPPAQWNPERVAASLTSLLDAPAVHQRCHELAQRICADDPATLIRNAVHGLASQGDIKSESTLQIETGSGSSLD
jgi:rhamnosyltransferase subunit B